MTPTLPEILNGVVVAIAEPPAPEAAGEFAAGRFGVIAMLSMLAAQEADRGPAAAVWENAAVRELCARSASAYDEGLGGVLAQAAAVTDGDGGLTALTAANAALRRALIALHEAAETRGDHALDRELLALYGEMARRRRLELPVQAG
jgi:hypothetical protein